MPSDEVVLLILFELRLSFRRCAINFSIHLFSFLQVLRLYATLWVMTDLKKHLYVHTLAWLCPSFVRFCCLAAVISLSAPFGLIPSSIQADLHLLGHFSALIPFLSPSLLLFLLFLLSLRILVVALLLFRLLAGLLTIFSRPESAT